MPKHAWFLDLFVVLAFAAAGRASHDLSTGVTGVLDTGWPFLVGMAIGWLVVVLALPDRARSWWLDGLVIAACALVIGMVLRQLTGDGTALPFVMVATGVLVAGLVGWRGIAAVVTTRREPESRAA